MTCRVVNAIMSEAATLAAKLLRTVFGCSSFRPPQEEVIASLLAGQNTLCLMPTGAGKSLCYQIAGLLTEKMTVVLSPLRALAAQQASILWLEHGLDTRAIDAGVSVKDQFKLLRELLADPPKFLFFSVERAAFDGYLEHVLREMKDAIGLIAVDEGHCVSQWGHSFRPAYKEIPDFLNRIFGKGSRPPVLCLTATLNPKDREDICKDFRIDADAVFQSPALFRDNLELHSELFENEEAKEQRLEQILKKHRGEKVLVYVHRKKSAHGTSALDERFQAKGFKCGYFDADLDTAERARVLQQFQDGEVDIVFATGAFGMGIHIPDIRVVVHYLIPESIEQYYQEVGRAGRDGKPSQCYLFFTETNVKVRRHLIRKSFPTENALREFFEKSLIFQEDGIADLDPLQSLSDTDLQSFHQLQAAGVISVVARGISKLNDFSPTVTTPPAVQNLFDASRTGLIRAVSKRSKTPFDEVTRRVFEGYTRSQLKLENSPLKILFIKRLKDLDHKTVERILAVWEERKANRIAALETLVSAIRDSNQLAPIIRRHLKI